MERLLDEAFMLTTVDSFLDDLASSSPVPGGGSVAALQVAMGAALLEMVSNLTIGRKRYADIEQEIKAIQDRAAELRERARVLTDEDADAYSHVSEAMHLPRGSEEEKQRRAVAVQDALKSAAQPPLATMKVADEVLTLAGKLVDIGNSSAVSDVGTAAMCALAGYQAALLNVEINAASVRDESWVGETRAQLAQFVDPSPRATDVWRRAEAAIRGA